MLHTSRPAWMAASSQPRTILPASPGYFRSAGIARFNETVARLPDRRRHRIYVRERMTDKGPIATGCLCSSNRVPDHAAELPLPAGNREGRRTICLSCPV